jgi:acetaldehyde dehydrogenase
MTKLTAAIVGSGNIGTDLMFKLLESDWVEPRWMVGVDPESKGLRRAAKAGLETTAEGVDWLLALDDLPDLVFEATAASVHAAYAPRYEKAGIVAIDLTPAAVGPYVIPNVNLREHIEKANVNMVTCGGQATVPIVHAVSSVTRVRYAEIVASISSRSAGPGTRANIDEFTETTAAAITVVGGAEPPLLMRDTVICSLEPDADHDAVADSIRETVDEVATYVPGYRLKVPPQFTEDRVTVLLEVEGRGDFLPVYAGNLDIMTAAAVRVGEEIARGREGAAAAR